MSETFNTVIIGPRQKPIVTMLEDLWATNRIKIEVYYGYVVPRIKKVLER